METGLQQRDKIGVQDAVLLEDYLSETAFVENLEKRFKHNQIYTYIGQVLISVNPYKKLDIYGPRDIKAYNGKHFFEVPPHVFAITDTAYRTLNEEIRDQCILISGESGSGKTEASKKILQYIAEVTDRKGEVEKVKNKLLDSNPILEAFGNAKTLRNDNSSRFGKYMDIQFNNEGNPVGGNILNYLLEKSRVISQVPGERNFHIFYLLLTGADDSRLESLQLKRDLSTYYYLTHGANSNVANIDDAQTYKEVENALNTLNFTEEEQNDMFSIIAAILHLGNVGFNEEDGKAFVSKKDVVETVAKLLNCDSTKLSKALVNKTIEATSDVVTSPLNRELAIYARDALAKAVYDRLFTWLVKRINSSLQPEQDRQHNVIGILDIYGFEIFDKNTFEQLCINFCNEKLHQLFIDLTLKSEQEEYMKEGIQWENIEYFDNKIILDLFEERYNGIIAFMDDECLRPGDANDTTLLQLLNQKLDRHKHYVSHKKADVKQQKIMGRDEFRIIHYAGVVTYNIKSFVEKNNDLLFRDLREAMTYSDNNILNTVFPKADLASKKRPDTAITQFKNSLNNLVQILRDKEPSYIRCIKPNDDQQPGIFDEEIVKHQVVYLGLMENLRVRRAGFAYRRLFEKFLQRYKCLSKQTWPNYHGDAKDGVQALVACLGYEKNDYQMGKTKIFIRHPKTLFDTEDAFQEKKNDIAAIIQASWKAVVQRRKFLTMRESAIMVQKYIRRFLAVRRTSRRRQAVQTLRKFIKGFMTRNDPPNDDNKTFAQITKGAWLNRLSKNLPTQLLSRPWPNPPYICKEASNLLFKMHGANLSRKYRKNLSKELEHQLRMKVLAEKLFQNKKKSYQASLPEPFKTERIIHTLIPLKEGIQPFLNGDKQLYLSDVTKFDRRGYKPRKRTVLITNRAFHLLDTTKTVKEKHGIPLKNLKFLVTPENDRMVLVILPQDLVKKEKGDIILEVPNLIEMITTILYSTKDNSQVTIIDQSPIKHNMKGKTGIIDYAVGNNESIQKDKNGHLLIVSK